MINSVTSSIQAQAFVKNDNLQVNNDNLQVKNDNSRVKNDNLQVKSDSSSPAHQSPDTVELSAAAQTALATLPASSQTSDQTVKDAGAGDVQAQHLLQSKAIDKAAAQQQ